MIPHQSQPKLISGNANRTLAEAISRRVSMSRGMSVSLVDARVERFNDQEIFVEVYENVRGEDMFIIQPTSNPANDNLMELLIMSDALRRSAAARITGVIPYFGYARQDRRAKARTPISAKLVANMIAASGIEARFPRDDFGACQVGIWGRIAGRDSVLQDGDRVEIYRPLKRDPREARRERARTPGG